ncbi:MAG: alpha/beta fold hydrolase [Candidatus Saccharimonadales bacterium]
MKRAIILHGMPSEAEYYNADRDSQSNSHWLPWLQQQLCVHSIVAQTPEMPTPYAPDYQAWCGEFEQYTIDKNTLLVGHSWGGYFLLRWLTENPDRIVGKVVLVAAWLDMEKEYGDLYNMPLPADLSQRVVGGIEYLYSTNDAVSMQTTLHYVKATVENVKYHEFVNYGHFTFKHMKTHEFPELLAICLAE